MTLLKKAFCLLMALIFTFCIQSKDIILEFKGAYYLPTNGEFKNIYHNGSALYGPEVTIQLCSDRSWYGFASVDYFKKKGNSIGLCNPTHIKLIPVTIGLKYLVPVFRDHISFYTGLGLVAENARIKNCSAFVPLHQSQWGIGGIAKVGAYGYLPHNFVIDMFIDYNFVKIGNSSCVVCTQPYLESMKANVSGAVFGVGLGYRF